MSVETKQTSDDDDSRWADWESPETTALERFKLYADHCREAGKTPLFVGKLAEFVRATARCEGGASFLTAFDACVKYAREGTVSIARLSAVETRVAGQQHEPPDGSDEIDADEHWHLYNEMQVILGSIGEADPIHYLVDQLDLFASDVSETDRNAARTVLGANPFRSPGALLNPLGGS